MPLVLLVRKTSAQNFLCASLHSAADLFLHGTIYYKKEEKNSSTLLEARRKKADNEFGTQKTKAYEETDRAYRRARVEIKGEFAESAFG